MSSSKIILITGATAGIGRTTALHLARLGHHVIATGRKRAELDTLAAEARPHKLDTVSLDVTDAASIAAAVTAVDQLLNGPRDATRGGVNAPAMPAQRGRESPLWIDVLVNNAGFGILGPTSEISDAEMRRQYDTNVFGLMNVTRAFLPRMRARRAGRIINLSSVGGRLVLPYFGVYSSTKYALEALSDALRYELRPFGIDVSLIEPGVIRTNFEATAVGDIARFAATPYAGALAKYEEMSRLADRFASDPIVIARAITKAVEARRPRARYVAPRSTHAFLFLASFLPQRMWDWAMRKAGYLTPSHLDMTDPLAWTPKAA